MGAVDFKRQNYVHLGARMIKKFERRGFAAKFFKDSNSAVEYVLSVIPEGASVAWGGSETVEDIGLLDRVKSGNFHAIDRYDWTTPEEERERILEIFGSDYYLMSTNAFTEDGELLNIDGRGNRLANLIYGPKHVFVITGMNKFTMGREEALNRVHNIAAPANCIRLQLKTPCAVNGVCGDCHGPDCICSQEVITRHCKPQGRIEIIMIGEDLGL